MVVLPLLQLLPSLQCFLTRYKDWKTSLRDREMELLMAVVVELKDGDSRDAQISQGT